MPSLYQIDHLEPSQLKKHHDLNESVRMECGRLINAAVVNRRFMNLLLTNPIKTIEAGFYGEKFAFTHEEKQRIKLIRASNLADFSSQLMQAIELPSYVPAVPEMVFVR